MPILAGGVVVIFRLSRFGSYLSAALLSLLANSSFASEQNFAKEVQPILKQHCYRCHDVDKQRSGYRLDVRSMAMAGGESGAKGIVSGKPDNSELIRRITTDDDDLVMPPTGKRLSRQEIETLTAWVQAGANWPDEMANEPAYTKHWAFQTPKRPAVPKVRPAAEVNNPIDAFVLAKLPEKGLSQSPRADKLTLARRLYLDLIGLPPSPQELDEFLADDQPGAIDRLVDKLLASPHYGERWGRVWLDAARYADSDGFEKDKPRFVWFYRDWVINALNKDLPYDKFIIEQLAGDLLPNPTQDQLVATGFLRNSMINEEGGIDPEQFRMEAMFDRMEAIGKGVLGLTVQCAQCHNHKFDPISQEEYFRLFAFLNNAHEASATVYTVEEQRQRAEIFQKIRELENQLRHTTPEWEHQFLAWQRQALAEAGKPNWRVVKPELDSSGGQKHYLLEDGSILAAGYAPSKTTEHFSAPVEAGRISAVRLEVLNDPSLPHGGPGRAVDGLFALTKLNAKIKPKGGKEIAVKFVRAEADAEAEEQPLAERYFDKTKRNRLIGPAAFAIDGKDETAWSIDVGPGRSNTARHAVFVMETPVVLPQGGVISFTLVQNHGGWNSNDNQSNNLGRFRFSVTDADKPKLDPVPLAIKRVLEIPAEERTDSQTTALFSHWRTTVADWKDINEQIETLWQSHPQGHSQLVFQEREAGQERMTRLLKRGDYLQPGHQVEPGVPDILHPMPKGAPANRLGFAQWLVDRRSPTTARSLVNRVWQTYFGTGIVDSPEDLGLQAAMPSHPELLDWLAVEFMEPSDGSTPWSMKRLHKLIVSSATYQQQSSAKPEQFRADPNNRLLTRGPRLRVDGEIVRDIALSASGLLNRKIGGASVYPPVPEFLLLPPASYGTKTWPVSTGEDRYRRSLYVFRFRSVPYPPLEAFDTPNGDTACVQRSRSNTPLQALTALNEPIFLEAARGLAGRMLREADKTEADRIRYGFRVCTGRLPSEAELEVLAELFKTSRQRFQDPNAKPAELWGTEFPEAVPAADAAAYLLVARALLNLDETITKE